MSAELPFILMRPKPVDRIKVANDELENVKEVEKPIAS